MSETKFGVLASLCYMLAFVSMAAGVIFTISRQATSLQIDTGLFAIAAVGFTACGFVFHAFHTSTLKRDALLTAILEAILMRQGGTRAPQKPAPAASERTEAWEVGKREGR